MFSQSYGGKFAVEFAHRLYKVGGTSWSRSILYKVGGRPLPGTDPGADLEILRGGGGVLGRNSSGGGG